VIVIVSVAVVSIVTFPKARFPLTPMIFVGTAVPVPEALMVAVPLVLSAFTVTVPLYVVTATGVNVTVTPWLPPAAIVPLHAPLNPVGYVMFVTVSVTLPLLVIVMVAVAVCPVVTFPNARFPLTPMIFVGTGIPVPEALIVFPPLVLSAFTVIVPLYAVTATGLNVTVTPWLPPAAIVPLHAPLNPVGYVMLLTVSTELPLLVIVMLAVAVCPVVTFPNARFPLTPMIFVGTGIPVPEALIAFPPLVLSEFTVTVPLYVVNVTGANVTVTSWLPPAAIVPLHAPLNPAG